MLKIHKASAGSGKTYSLTREYLKLLLGYKKGGRYRLRPLSAYGYQKPKAHGEILAVTLQHWPMRPACAKARILRSS